MPDPAEDSQSTLIVVLETHRLRHNGEYYQTSYTVEQSDNLNLLQRRKARTVVSLKTGHHIPACPLQNSQPLIQIGREVLLSS